MATTAAPAATRPTKRRSGIPESRLATLMVSPSMILIAIVAAYPIGYAVWLSLHEYSVRVPGLSRWAGLRNYETAVTSDGWLSALGTTFLFTGT